MRSLRPSWTSLLPSPSRARSRFSNGKKAQKAHTGARPTASASEPMRVFAERAVRIPLNGAVLEGDLWIPDAASALVVFAHGSGSSRWSPRNRFAARLLTGRRLATLLVDLLTAEEVLRTTMLELSCDIKLLADRLTGITDWASRYAETWRLPLGYFGASTGAAAALVAAARRPDSVRALVSRGGHPDLAGAAVYDVRAPTLLIVGENDAHVLQLNRVVADEMRCERQLAVVPDASHLFDEPGALDQVAILARDWFLRYLVPASGI